MGWIFLTALGFLQKHLQTQFCKLSGQVMIREQRASIVALEEPLTYEAIGKNFLKN